MQRRWYSVWDPEVPKSFEPEKPWPEYLRDTAISMPNRVAITFHGKDLTYHELNETIDKFAYALADLGVKKGDRVGIYIQNCPQFVISYFAILRAGAVLVALDPMFKHFELEHELNDSGVETLVLQKVLHAEVAKIRDRVRLKNLVLASLEDCLSEERGRGVASEKDQPNLISIRVLDFLPVLRESSAKLLDLPINLKEDLALLQYTGGTTGLPKGVMITHYSLAYAAGAIGLWYKYTKDDVHVCVTPFSHVSGMLNMNAQLASGGRLVILGRFTPEAVAKAISQYRCTKLIAAPTAFSALLSWPNIEQYDLSSLQVLVTGGAPMPLETQSRLRELVPTAVIADGYGLTETTAQGGALTPFHRYKAGFVGIPHIGVDMKIVDLETGSKELPPNEEGEILIKGPTVMRGYWGKPKETAEILREGWIHTGDIGSMDQEGYLRVVGRKKELIICAGYNVFPSEVEALLHKHPAVAEVAVIGIPDSFWGETPKAFVVLRPEYRKKIREEQIQKWCGKNVAAYKCPHRIEFRNELPKNAAGKILRRVLAEEERRKGSTS